MIPSPGRFYVSVVVKTIVTIIASGYDLTLPEKDQKVEITVGPAMIPSPWLQLRFRERKTVE